MIDRNQIDRHQVSEQLLNKSSDTKLSRIITKMMVIVIISMVIFLIVMESVFAVIRHQGVERIQLNTNDSKPVNHIVEAPNGDLWVRDGRNIWQFDKGDIDSVTVPDDIFSTDSYILDFAIAPNGTFWGTYEDWPNSVVDSLNGETWTQYDFSERVKVIAIEPSGIVWLGTENGAMRLVDNSWQTFTQADGLITNNVSAIAFSPEGGVWFEGSVETDDDYVDGLSYFDGEKVTKVFGFAEFITAIAIDPDGVLWVGTSQGLSRFDSDVWATYMIEGGFLGKHNKSVYDIAFGSDKTIWIEASNFIYQFDGEKWRMLVRLSSSVLLNEIADIFVDDQNNLWVASHSDGLYVYDVSRITVPVPLFKTWQFLRKFLGGVTFILIFIVGVHEAKKRFSESQKTAAISLNSGLLAGVIGYFVIVSMFFVSGSGESLILMGMFIVGPAVGVLVALVTIYIVYKRR